MLLGFVIKTMDLLFGEGSVCIFGSPGPSQVSVRWARFCQWWLFSRSCLACHFCHIGAGPQADTLHLSQSVLMIL